MNRKKSVLIVSTGILLLVMGLVSIVLAGVLQDTVNKTAVTVLGLSSFGFWGAALFVLIKNYSALVTAELDVKIDKLYKEENFFTTIRVHENPESLKERFTKAGFKMQDGYLYKRRFSFFRDYINYFVTIAEDKNIPTQYDVQVKKAEIYFETKKRFHKNNVLYMVFFKQGLSQTESDFIQNLLICQDMEQEFSADSTTVVPIVYDISTQKYILRTLNHRISIKLLHTALRKLYKLINLKKERDGHEEKQEDR